MDRHLPEINLIHFRDRSIKTIEGLNSESRSKFTTNWSGIILTLIWVPLAFAIYYLSHQIHPDWYKHFVYQARGFLAGRLDLWGLPDYYIDFINWQGKVYLPNPPLPSILLMPFVAIWGIATEQIRVCMLVSAIDVALVWVLLSRMQVKGAIKVGLTLLYGFGTVHYSAAILGTIWFYAHVVAELGLLLALVEFFGKKRFWLIGFCMGLAFLSRQATVLGSIFFVGWLVWHRPERWFRSFISYCLGFTPLFLFQSWFNWARFGKPLESGYLLQNWYSSVQSPEIEKYGFFNSAYILKHIKLIFTEMPEILPKFPFLRPKPEGMNIWLTTPALFGLLVTKWMEPLQILAGLAAFAVSLPAYIYTATGWVQFGYRYTLDYLPFLFIPMVSGLLRMPRFMAWALISLSIMVNAWGVYWAVKLGW
jgi:hypothetical protein